jgi:hypothetical protein
MHNIRYSLSSPVHRETIVFLNNIVGGLVNFFCTDQLAANLNQIILCYTHSL